MVQDDYDCLLWCCDLNVVCGEDFFVCVQWVGWLLFWYIYRQEEEVYLVKFEVFFEFYCVGLFVDLVENLCIFWLVWNVGGGFVGVWEGLER